MNQTKVADLTIDEFRTLIQDVVAQTLSDLIKDRDEGLDLNPEVENRLRESLAAYKTASSLSDAQVLGSLGVHGVTVLNINFCNELHEFSRIFCFFRVNSRKFDANFI